MLSGTLLFHLQDMNIFVPADPPDTVLKILPNYYTFFHILLCIFT